MPGPHHKGDYRRIKIRLPNGTRTNISLPGYLVDAAVREWGEGGFREWVRSQACNESYTVASRLFQRLIELARGS